MPIPVGLFPLCGQIAVVRREGSISERKMLERPGWKAQRHFECRHNMRNSGMAAGHFISHVGGKETVKVKRRG